MANIIIVLRTNYIPHPPSPSWGADLCGGVEGGYQPLPRRHLRPPTGQLRRRQVSTRARASLSCLSYWIFFIEFWLLFYNIVQYLIVLCSSIWTEFFYIPLFHIGSNKHIIIKSYSTTNEQSGVPRVVCWYQQYCFLRASTIMFNITVNTFMSMIKG